MLEGIDVSVFQGRIDWQQLKLAGKRFAFIKATEGLQFRDPTFGHNWQQALHVGIPRIAYHFFYDNLDALGQLAFFHEYVRLHGRFEYGDAVMIDCEEVSLTGVGGTVEKLRDMVLNIWYEIDKPVIIYTNPDTWVSRLGDPTDDVLSQCPLFLADYGGRIPTLKNWPNGLSFWQYSDAGHAPGIVGEVDLDRFFGTRKQLQQILNTVPKHG